MNVAFVNENTLGHTSHVPRFVETLQANPGLGIVPYRIDAMPLPEHLRSAERGIRGLNRFGLDWLLMRWRRATSRHVVDQVLELRQRVRLDALLVNTQSVGLLLPEAVPDVPCWVALDATFAELRDSPWFAPTTAARWFHPLTLRWLLRREARLLQHATGLLPWSEHVVQALGRHHPRLRCPIHRLPPSLRDPGTGRPPAPGPRPRLLFLGGDFRRKGGRELLAAWESGLRTRCDLDVVTHDAVSEQPGLKVHRGVKAGSPAWEALWRGASVFVFPSHLETFGIVLLEALAFGVPVVASRAGAAEEILAGGQAGELLGALTPDAIVQAVQRVLDSPETTQRRAQTGRNRFLERYELSVNTARLAGWLRVSAPAKA